MEHYVAPPSIRAGTPHHALSWLLLFVALCALAGRPVHAQDVSTYQLTASPGTFTPIAGGTVIPDFAQLNTPIYLPFDFVYGGTTYSSFQPTPYGYLRLAIGAIYVPTNAFDGSTTIVAPLWDALSDVGGTASYVTTGTAPNRVFTFEWLNWRWGTGATAANISFQAKLYEGSNVIQFVYRPEAGAFNSAAASATIGLDGGLFSAGDNNEYWDFCSLTNASTNPGLSNNAYPTGASVNTINTRPAAGQTYTFTPTNDYCAHATPLPLGSTVIGSTLVASQAGDPRSICTVGSVTPSNAPGVYYKVTGNGQPITVTTCSGPTATANDTKLFVYRGSCGSFTCIGSNDNLLTGGCGTNPLASSVTFASQVGMEYTIYAQYAIRSARGAFGLSISGTTTATTAALGLGTLDVFPNPATQAVTVRLPALAGERTAHLTLRNALGQQVLTRTLTLQASGTDHALDVQRLPTGLYTVQVRAGSQRATRTLRID